MFARSITIRLKPDSAAAFTKLIEDQTSPLLRKQKGFQDAITMIVPGGREAAAFSLWDLKENAEAYSRSGYTEVLKALEKLTEGSPQVRTYEVSNSTFHKIAAHVAA